MSKRKPRHPVSDDRQSAGAEQSTAPERRPRYSDEEFLRRGEEIFARKILPLVANENPRKFVLIDIETEDFEVDDNPIPAADRLIAKNPDSQIWSRRVGSVSTTWFNGLPRTISHQIRKRTG